MNRRVALLSFFLCAFVAAPLHAQRFGGPVAVGADQLIVGEGSNQTFAGIVYLYAENSTGWQEVGRLTVDGEVGPPDGFGRALAANGSLLLVGAPLHDEGRGSTFVYQAVGATWTQVARLVGSDATAGAAFGGAISLSGDVALISAAGDQEGAGAVYVFHREVDGMWTETSKIIADEPAAGAGFGTLVAFDGDVAVVATRVPRGADGSVYAYSLDATSGQPTSGSRLEGANLGERSGFGGALGVRDGVVLVGAPGLNSRTGGVFVFRRDEAGEWGGDGALSPFLGQQGTQFGASIGYDDQRTWVGAPGDNGGAGAFYQFARDGAGSWTGVGKMASDLSEAAPAFSSSIAVGGGLAVAGAGGVDSRAGGAVILSQDDDGAWGTETLVVGDYRSFPAVAGGEIECTDSEAAGFECNSVNVVSFLPTKELGGGRGTSVNDIWGWTDPDNGREYAVVGRTDGTSFVDVSDPYNPVYLGELPKTEGSRSSIWRDMKVFEDHAYIVADAAGAHGMQVFDLKQLRDFDGTPVTYEATFLYDEINSAHNIVINEDTGFGYAVGSSGGGTTCGGGLHMISLENPAEPTFAGCFFDVTTGRSKTGYSHDAQCVLYHGPDVEHQGKEICLGSNETALSIADVSDKSNPEALSVVSYPNVAYAHQGWLTEDHRYYYMNDEGDEPQGLVTGTRTLVWDVMDLDDPVLIKEHIAETTSTDHNLYVRGDRMYQSNYGAGLRVFDISDPEDPVEIGFFDTTPYGGGGSWSNYPYFESGIVLTTSMGDGLFVLKSTGRKNLIP